MSTEELAILADALTFALLVTVGGLTVWWVVRLTWRRPALQRVAKVSVSAAALVAVGIAGVAVWPTARQGVTLAADAAGVDVAPSEPTEAFPFDENPVASLAPSTETGRPARVREVAAIGTEGGTPVAPSPPPPQGDPGGDGATPPPPPPPLDRACDDGADNDRDGRIDFPRDPGCASVTDNTEADASPPPPPAAVCNDGVDNDGDGLTDFPADPGCASATDGTEADSSPPPPPPPPPTPACSDGNDNDGDGQTDFPADPGCDSTSDDTEAPDPPPPTAACSDGADNDGDGLTDFPADPGCDGSSDDTEADPLSPSRSTLGELRQVAWASRSRVSW
jgi:hypothetical protein